MQCKLAHDYAFKCSRTGQEKATVAQQIAEIVDLVCDALMCEMSAAGEGSSSDSSVSNAFRNTRHELLSMFGE